jgi:hypothetical protein
MYKWTNKKCMNDESNETRNQQFKEWIKKVRIVRTNKPINELMDEKGTNPIPNLAQSFTYSIHNFEQSTEHFFLALNKNFLTSYSWNNLYCICNTTRGNSVIEQVRKKRFCSVFECSFRKLIKYCQLKMPRSFKKHIFNPFTGDFDLPKRICLNGLFCSFFWFHKKKCFFWFHKKSVFLHFLKHQKVFSENV